MAATYPSGVPAFPALNAGDMVLDTHPERAYEEIAAIATALVSSGFAHALLPDASANARALGSASKFWGLGYVKGLVLAASTELTVAAGAVTAVQGVHSLDTESDAASDDLVTITAGSGLAQGAVLILRAEDVSRVVTLKDGAGNLLLNGDYALSATDRTITLLYDGANWREVARSVTAAAVDSVDVLNRDAVVSDVASSTAETTVYSYTIPAGTFGATGAVRLSLLADYLNNSGGAATVTVKVKLGATTVFNGGMSASSNSNRSGHVLDVVIAACNATNAQRSYGRWSAPEGSENNNAGVASAVGTSTHKVMEASHGAIAEDSTASLTLQVTVQHTVSHANISFRCHNALLEVL